MPHVGIGRLVAVERLALADRSAARGRPVAAADVRAERVGAVPDVDHHQEDEDQPRPSHRFDSASAAVGRPGPHQRSRYSRTGRERPGDRKTSRSAVSPSSSRSRSSRVAHDSGSISSYGGGSNEPQRKWVTPYWRIDLLDPPRVVIAGHEDGRPVAGDPELPGEPGHDPGIGRHLIRDAPGSSRRPRGSPASGAGRAWSARRRHKPRSGRPRPSRRSRPPARGRPRRRIASTAEPLDQAGDRRRQHQHVHRHVVPAELGDLGHVGDALERRQHEDHDDRRDQQVDLAPGPPRDRSRPKNPATIGRPTIIVEYDDDDQQRLDLHADDLRQIRRGVELRGERVPLLVMVDGPGEVVFKVGRIRVERAAVFVDRWPRPRAGSTRRDRTRPDQQRDRPNRRRP